MRLAAILAIGLGLAAAVAPGEELRIGVFGLFEPKTLTVRAAPGEVVDLRVGRDSLLLEGGAEATFRLLEGSVGCSFRGRDLIADRIRIDRRGQDAGFELSVPGRIRRLFTGRLEIAAADGSLGAVVAMPLERAVGSAVASESPRGATQDALRAQAIVSRSYYAAGPRHELFDFCDTTHCQFLREAPAADDGAARAAEDTAGVVIRAGGGIVQALYTRRCGGRTRSLEEVRMGESSYPYFPVECPPCLRERKEWVRTLAASPLTLRLLERPSEGDRIRLGRLAGWDALPGNVYTARRVNERIEFRGAGFGHGVGLCQIGSAGLAESGMRFEEILRHYFLNTTLGALISR